MNNQLSIIKNLDIKIRNIDKNIEKIELQKKDILSYLDSKVFELVNYGTKSHKTFKKTNYELVDKIPVDWNESRLRYHADFKTGGTPDNSEGITVDEKNSYNWFTPGDFNLSLELKNSQQYITEEAVKRNNYKLFPRNSILYVCIASVGKIGLTFEDSYSNQQITAIKPKRINSKYLLYLLYAKTSFIKANALYTVVPIINTTFLKDIKIVLPSSQEQQDIVESIEKLIMKTENILKEKTENIAMLKSYRESVLYNSLKSNN
jgi:type I restriction enzyme S subunit